MAKRMIRDLLPRHLLEKIQKFLRQGSNFKSLAKNYGQWRSIRDWSSIGGSGQAIPWYTYPATEFLSHLNLSDLRVFEYGSGNSTLWWAQHASQVTSVEDDELWYQRIKAELSATNVIYLLEYDRQRYSSMASHDFDIFIVDGKYRRECLDHVISLGGKGIMIILDNADWYPKTVQFIQEQLGWMQVDFHGFGPINGYTWTTSIFVNPARYHELRYRTALKSQCGLVQQADGDY